MEEAFLLIGGWTRIVSSYKKLIKTKPPMTRIYILPHNELSLNDDEIFSKIITLLNTEKLQKINLVGHSLGGVLAIKFTHIHPQYVKKLILIDSEGIAVKESIFSLLLHTLITNLVVSNIEKWWENRKAMVRAMLHPIYYTKTGFFAHLVDIQSEAKDIKVPTIIIWGEKDIMLPVSQGEMLHKLIKNSKLIVLPGMDHDWLLNYPQGLWGNI